MERILITGGCGFVGCNLIPRLLGSGRYTVRVIDNLSLGKRAWIDEFDTEFVEGDIRNPDAVDAALEGVDAVVHLAADTRVMDSIEDPAKNFDHNVAGSFTLLQRMRAAGVTRIVNASTGGAIMGEVDPPVHEDMTPRPTAPYGASKLAVEGYVSAFSGAYGFDGVSLRFSNVYGPRSFHKGSVVATFIRQMLRGETLTVYGDGSQTRDYIFSEDLADGIVRAIEARVSGVYQLGTGRGTSLNTLIETLAAVTGLEPDVRYEDFRPGELVHTWCDVRKARNAFGFDPSTPLEEGLAQAWDWFKAQG
jgi:UDP-glucose 4-epimerase